MTTRVSGSSEQQRMVKSIGIMYNLCNEPWMKYNIILVADRGLTKPTFTSARLKRGEVLYMENHFHRYELCFIGEKFVKSGSTSHAPDSKVSQNHHSNAANGDGTDEDGEIVDMFRFSRCKKNLSQATMLEYGIPLPVDLLEVIHDDLDWEDVLWSDKGVWVGGKEYRLVMMLFLSPTEGVTVL